MVEQITVPSSLDPAVGILFVAHRQVRMKRIQHCEVDVEDQDVVRNSRFHRYAIRSS